MLADLINKIWNKSGWKEDERIQALLTSKKDAGWAYDCALQAIQAETRIADKFFTLSIKQREDIILITAALFFCGELPCPWTGIYIDAHR